MKIAITSGGMEVGTLKDAYQQAFATYDYDGDNTSTSKDASMHPEIGYRELNFDQTFNAWNKAGFFDIISSEIFFQIGPDFVKNFRNAFGDYYVAGYQ